jgi:hypothetical protein
MRLSGGSARAVGGRLIGPLTGLLVAIAAALPPAAAASSLTQVRSVYRSVLTAEYFGPASTVCSRLTATGRASFEAGGGGTCAHAFALQQHVLRHRVPGVDDSGYSPTAWRQVVAEVVAALKITVHGARASAIGPSGIPGLTRLEKVGGRWLFTTYPPSIES